MSTPPTISPLITPAMDQQRTDAEQLNLLAIFHFICAGLALLGILFLCGHYFLLHLFFTDPKMLGAQKQAQFPVEFFAIFKWFYLVGAVWLVASGILNLVSGFCLRARKRRTFSLVVAGLNCMHIPLGTILGIFTIMVLQRGSVVASYKD